MRRTGRAIAAIARKYPDHLIVFPTHSNPLIREQIVPSVQALDNVYVCDSMDYQEFVHAMKWASVILTDSGGVHEEAPSLGKPVLVLRDKTERPEAVAAGTVKLVGTDVQRVVEEVSALIDDPSRYALMARAVNPYGDGRAAERSAAAIAELLGVGKRLEDFEEKSLPRTAT